MRSREPDFIAAVANRRPTSGNPAASWLIGDCSSVDDVLDPRIDAPGTGNEPVGENNDEGSADDYSQSCFLVASACPNFRNGHTDSRAIASIFVRHPVASARRLAVFVCSFAVYVSAFCISEAGSSNCPGFFDN